MIHALFVVLIYARAWFTAQLAADAAPNDLTLLCDLTAYRDVAVANSALKTFRRHL